MVKRKQKKKQFHDFLTDGVTEKEQADNDISECRNEPARTGMVNLPVPPVKFTKQRQPRSRSPLVKKNKCLKDNSESSSRLPLAMSQQSSGTPPVTQSKKSTSQPLVTQITSISSRPQLAMLEQSSARPPVTQSKKSTSQPLVTQTTSVSSRPQLAKSQQSSDRPPVT
ncbi:merozoite surface antigen 2-like [Mizuhopecten yessoensis]|uniref:merozoite surface antigen 2-like n=1 Tax=Mizuhopecten yessoensis TaxID=6573 RepID=UPI000B45CDD1|nr:merozoite surface antigen 2-like [Mizuhopecten yessoensis]